MRVLLTNTNLSARAGTQLYVHDVAIELLNRGHQPVAFSTVPGPIAESLRAATVPVVDNLDRMAEPPDVIHGQHHFETLMALLHFPGVPAISFCHGWTPWEEQPLIFPRVLRYVAVDEVCRDRLVAEHGIAPECVRVVFNFVDPARFKPRSPLPPAPRRALAFGNEFVEGPALSAIRSACAAAGIQLDVAGIGAGRPESEPERLLPAYDLVFARARAALEAMAVGTAVVLCGPRGLGPLVTPEDWERLRRLNFGVRTFTNPVTDGGVAEQIRRYAPAAAEAVSVRVRTEATLSGAVDQLVGVYEVAIREARSRRFDVASDVVAASRYLHTHAAMLKGLARMESDRVRELETVVATAEAALADTLAELRETQSALRRTEAERERWHTEWARLHDSATWRISRAVLDSAPLRAVLNPLVKRIRG
jgi:hypothetical protein